MTDCLAHASQAWRKAQHDWIEVREHWRGVTSDHYEQAIWTRLEEASRRHLTALEHLEEALAVIARLPRP